MQTRELYYEDPMCSHFTATVTACQALEGGRFAVTLDQTAFFPEGGGQPGDRGTLTYDGAAVSVLDTQLQAGEPTHLCAAPIPVGETVDGALDWPHRFDLMQQHAGEHLVSGEIHRRFGYDNVGFHMGAELVTVDYNGLLTWQDLAPIEAAVNAAVWQDIPCRAWYPADLAAEHYRSKKALEGPVRLVQFAGCDTCACCGVHVERTGQIGLIKLLSVTKFRTGVRIEMACGARALAVVNAQLAQNREISQALSAKPDATARAVARLQGELAAVKTRLHDLENEAAARVAETYAGQGSALHFTSGLAGDALRRLCLAIFETCGGRAAVFSQVGNVWQYAIAAPEGQDLRPVAKAMNAALSGRGGGKPGFIQGAVAADRDAIAKCVSKMNF